MNPDREEHNRERAGLAIKKLRQLLEVAVSRGFRGKITLDVYSQDGSIGKIASTCQEFDDPARKT